MNRFARTGEIATLAEYLIPLDQRAVIALRRRFEPPLHIQQHPAAVGCGPPPSERGPTARSRRKTRHTTHLDGFPPTVRIVRARHALEGRSLELAGWMRRRRQLELIVVLQDGSTLLVPAKWTDLEGHAEPVAAGTLGSLDDLLAARRVLDRVLRAAPPEEPAQSVVLAERDDLVGEDISDAVASGSGGVPSAGGGAVGAGRRSGAPGGDRAAERADRRGGRRPGRGGIR